MDKIRFSIPNVGNLETGYIADIVDSRWIANGPKVKEFEERIAKLSGCDRAVAYDSCTGALEMALRVLNIGEGDEVITTPFTYSATAEVIHNVGAKIVFADLAKDSFEMDYSQVADLINERTKAIIPVDYGGKICDYDTLYEIVKSKESLFQPSGSIQKKLGRIAIIADAAHSFAATRKGKVSGEYADFTCFSFHVVKNITTGGEGGAIVWKDIFGEYNDSVETVLRLLGDHGQTSRDKTNGWEYDIMLFGYNSIMTDIDAGMGLAQLDRLDWITKLRTEITKKYDELFLDASGVKPMIKHFGDDYITAQHLYPVRLEVPKGYDSCTFRNMVYTRLKDLGIPCNVHYKPLPMMTAYKTIGFDIKAFPEAFQRYSSLLTIPYHSELSENQQEYIVKSMVQVVKNL